MNIAITMLLRQLFTVQFGLIVICAMKDDLSSHALHRGNLTWIGVFGNNDDGFDVEKPGGVGNGLPMIASGGCDDAVLALLLTELGNKVDAATYLECPYRLVVLVFYIKRCPD